MILAHKPSYRERNITETCSTAVLYKNARSDCAVMRLPDTQQDALTTVFTAWSDTPCHDPVGAYWYENATDTI